MWLVLEYLSTKFNTSSITPLCIFSFTLAYLRFLLKLQFNSKETLFQSIYLAEAPECASIPLYTLSFGCSISCWSLFFLFRLILEYLKNMSEAMLVGIGVTVQKGLGWYHIIILKMFLSDCHWFLFSLRIMHEELHMLPLVYMYLV